MKTKHHSKQLTAANQADWCQKRVYTYKNSIVRRHNKTDPLLRETHSIGQNRQILWDDIIITNYIILRQLMMSLELSREAPHKIVAYYRPQKGSVRDPNLRSKHVTMYSLNIFSEITEFGENWSTNFEDNILP